MLLLAVTNDKMVQPFFFSKNSKGPSICSQPTTISAFGDGLVVLVIPMVRDPPAEGSPLPLYIERCSCGRAQHFPSMLYCT